LIQGQVFRPAQAGVPPKGGCDFCVVGFANRLHDIPNVRYDVTLKGVGLPCQNKSSPIEEYMILFVIGWMGGDDETQ